MQISIRVGSSAMPAKSRVCSCRPSMGIAAFTPRASGAIPEAGYSRALQVQHPRDSRAARCSVRGVAWTNSRNIACGGSCSLIGGGRDGAGPGPRCSISGLVRYVDSVDIYMSPGAPVPSPATISGRFLATAEHARALGEDFMLALARRARDSVQVHRRRTGHRKGRQSRDPSCDLGLG